MNRKRFIKKLMGHGYTRGEAQSAVAFVHCFKESYKIAYNDFVQYKKAVEGWPHVDNFDGVTPFGPLYYWAIAVWFCRIREEADRRLIEATKESIAAGEWDGAEIDYFEREAHVDNSGTAFGKGETATWWDWPLDV